MLTRHAFRMCALHVSPDAVRSAFHYHVSGLNHLQFYSTQNTQAVARMGSIHWLSHIEVLRTGANCAVTASLT